LEYYIALLLMIVPGFITRNIFSTLNTKSRAAFEIDNIIISLIYSLFVTILNVICLLPRYGIDSIETLYILFGSFRFILKYVAITLVNSLSLAYLWTIIWSISKSPLLAVINYIRKQLGKNNVDSSSSFLDSLSDGYQHVLKIDSNGKTDYGFLEKIERNDDGKVNGLILIKGAELKSKVEKVGEANIPAKYTYRSINSDFIVTEFKSASLLKSIKKHPMKLLLYGVVLFIFVHAIILGISVIA
jgi:hypothetical protein